MTLADMIERKTPPGPWEEGDNIPWDDPEFSERMLAEHLSQSHHLASRKREKIDQHIAWIHETVLRRKPARVLDLACGPGLYTGRLARLGCECVGIDFAPAALAHARAAAEREGLSCTYVQADVREADFGAGHDLVMMLSGQFNVFTRDAARRILAKARAALAPGGAVLLEPQRFETVRGEGQARTSSWYTVAGAGLFSDRAHLVCQEDFWDEPSRTKTQRYHVVDAETARVTRHVLSAVAYTEDELRRLLAETGFEGVEVHPSLIGAPDADDPWNLAVVARTP